MRTILKFQRLPSARGGTAKIIIFHMANWSQLIHPGPSLSRSIFFMESSQSFAAMLTHYSTERLTTGPDYDPLLRLLALAGDVPPNPGPPRYPCSVCFKNITSQGTSYLCTRCSPWVHSGCTGLRNVADYHRAYGLDLYRHHSHAHLPHRIVPSTRPPCQTGRSTYYNRTPMASATNGRN